MQALEIASSRALRADDAEQAAIGCLLRSNKDARIIAELSDDDFTNEDARKCFVVGKALVARNAAIDLVTMDAEMFKRYKKDDAQNAMNYAMSAMTTFLFNAPQYVAKIREASQRRKLVEIGDKISRSALDSGEDMDALIESARASLRDMVMTNGKWATMADLLFESFEHLEKMTKGDVAAITTGISDMDKATGGMFAGEMTIVGARPSVGKTAFGLQIAMSAAKSGAKVCFISVEMSRRQMGNRIISREALIDGTKIRNAIINDDDWGLITDAMCACGGLPIQFLHGSVAVETLRAEVQRKVDLGECDLVVIDYLQLLTTKQRFDKDHERIGYISRTLKLMSLEFKIPVVVLAQVRRQNNQGRSRCPALDELRGSGDIEQDADNVIFLHRPDDKADPTIDKRDVMYFDALKEAGLTYMVFNMAKMRQGQTGFISAAFDSAHMRYISLDRMRDDGNGV